MNKQKDLQEIDDYIKKIESKLESIRESLCKDSGDGSKHSAFKRQQNNQPPESKEAPYFSDGLSNSLIRSAILLACKDNSLSAEQIIQGLGLNKSEGRFLKTFISACRKANRVISSEFYATDNTSHVLKPTDSITDASIRYGNDHVNLGSMRSAIQRELDNNNAEIDSHIFDEYLCALYANKQQNLFHQHFPVATGGDGGGDSGPNSTKLTVNPPRSDFPPDYLRYRIGLEIKPSKEIHSEVLPKEYDCLEDFDKVIKSPLGQLSWREKSEENCVNKVSTSEEEEDNEALASPKRCEQMDDMIDPLLIFGLSDDEIQHSADMKTEGNQDDEDDNSDANDDSGSEIDDNDGGGTLPEDIGPPVQTPLVAARGVIEMESTSDGNRELAGAERKNILPIDYVSHQGQLVGKQSHDSTYSQSKTPDTKPNLVINSHYHITVNEDEVIANLTVNTNLQDAQLSMPQGQPDYDHQLNGDNDGSNIEAENNSPVEQAQELPLSYPSFEPNTFPPTIEHSCSLPQFVDTEDQPAPLPNEDQESFTEDEPEAYVDAVEAQPEDSEESCQQSVFVSPSAENPSDQVEEVHMRVPKRRWWTDCCLV